MKTSFASATFAVVLGMATSALAVCGDVNGDKEKTSSDALAVLRSAVGQQVPLVCDDGPSRIRLFNGIVCSSGSQTTTLSFNGFEYSAGLADPTPYQVVDLPSISDAQGTMCGGQLEFSFEGPYNLPRNRSLTAQIVIGHPDAYNSGEELVGFLVLRDDAVPASVSSLDSDSPAEMEEAAVFSGTIRRRQP